MTASVQLICDAAMPYGTCPTRLLVVRASNAATARYEASGRGWTSTSDGRDRCPHHSGRKP